MLKVYGSKARAIRFAKETYGAQWQKAARFLEIALPEGEVLYCVQQRGERPASSRAAKPIAPRHSLATKPLKASDGIIKRCQAIFDLLGASKPRKELLAECVKQGAALSTAATQYQRWKKLKASGGGQ